MFCAGEWEHWNTRVEEYIYPEDSVPDYSSILVPNVDNVRTNFLIDCIAKQHKVSHRLYSISRDRFPALGPSYSLSHNPFLSQLLLVMS